MPQLARLIASAEDVIRTAEYDANLRWWLEETSATATSVRRANERLFLSMFEPKPRNTPQDPFVRVSGRNITGVLHCQRTTVNRCGSSRAAAQSNSTKEAFVWKALI